MTISDRIEKARELRGVSLTHLNNAIGAYRGKLTEVRKGKASLSDVELSILAKELSTSTDYLLGNTDDPTPAGQKAKPPAQGGELDNMLIDRLVQLTPDELEKVDAFVQGLIAARGV